MSDKDIITSFLPVIDKWLHFKTYYNEIPSVSAGIYFQDEVIFTKSYGYASVESKQKASPQTMYRIASHSKLFTATLIMKLYERGLLSIDDKVNKFLPWLPSSLVDIRIRHLLTHSSGLTRDSRFGQWFHHKFPDKQSFIQALNQENKIFEPNMFFKYSNIGFTLLGLIIEAVTQQSFQKNIESLVTELGLQHTIHDYSDSFKDNHATGYSRKFPHQERTILEHVPANIMSSATGLSSTVDDLLKFYEAHFLGNNKLLSDPYKRDMQQIHYVDTTKNIQWGFGFAKIPYTKIPFNGHSGGYPGFISFSGFNLDKRLSIVVLTNAIDGPAQELFTGIADFIHFALSHKNSFITKTKFTIPDVISGFYRNNWGISFLQKVGNSIVLGKPLIPSTAFILSVLEQKDENIFILPEGNGMDNAGEELIIHFDEDKIQLEQAGAFFDQFNFSI